MLAFVKTGTSHGAQPLPVSSWGHDGEEVAYLSITWLMLEEGIMIAPGLSTWPALLLFLLGLGCLGLC
jgi:hypothetical protein